MKSMILLMSALNVMFVLMHELDACYRGEWKMFKFLRNLKETTQYFIFLYFHIPLILFLIYYLWTVFNYNNLILWIIWNFLMIFHLIIHLIAKKWKTNVFQSIHSFVFIGGAAVTGLINLLLIKYY